MPPSPQPILEPPSPGTPQVLVNGSPVSVTTRVASEGQSLLVEGDGFSASVSPTDATGKPLPIPEGGQVILTQDSVISVVVEGFCSNCAVDVYWHPTQDSGISARAQTGEMLLARGEASADGLFTHDVGLNTMVPVGAGVLQMVGATTNGGILAMNVAMAVRAPDSQAPAITINARRGGGRNQDLVTVRGTVAGIASAQATISVRTGRGPARVVRQATVALSPEGTFSWTTKCRVAARVVVQADGMLSNVVYVKARDPRASRSSPGSPSR